MRLKNQQEEQTPIRVILVQDGSGDRQIKGVLDCMPELEMVAVLHDFQIDREKILKHKPHVIVLDLSCNVSAGDLLRRVCSTYSVALLPENEPAHAVPLLMAGATACISNKSRPDQILLAIRTVSFGYTIMSSETAAHIIASLRAMVTGGDERLTFEDSRGVVKAIKDEASTGKFYAPEIKETDGFEKTPGKKNADTVDSGTKLGVLSPRELEALVLIVNGCSNQQIADHLTISLATAKAHVRNILNKLSVPDRTQAAVLAMRLGLV